MFAGIDIASEHHMRARLDDAGEPIGKPLSISEDRDGYDAPLKALGSSPVLIVMEATGQYWKNLFAVLVAAGHKVVLLNPFVARRFQDSTLERTKTDSIDAPGRAQFGFEKRPAPTRLNHEGAEALRELVRHRPTAQEFARAIPRRLAKLHYDGRHFVGPELAKDLIETAKRSVGQHHGSAYKLQAKHIRQDLDLWRRQLADLDRDMIDLLEAHDVGKLLTSVDGLGPQTAARIIAAIGDPARFKNAAAFAAYVGVVPSLQRSRKRTASRAGIGPFGNAGLRRAMWMPVRVAVKRNPWLHTFYDRFRTAGKPPKLALIAAMRKLLRAIYSVAKHRKPFTTATEQAWPT